MYDLGATIEAAMDVAKSLTAGLQSEGGRSRLIFTFYSVIKYVNCNARRNFHLAARIVESLIHISLS